VAAILAIGSVSQKLFGQHNDAKGIYLFSAMCCIGGMLAFIVIGGNSLHFTAAVLGHSIGFAVAYGTCMVCNVLALKYGSMSLTSLFTSYSLMVPTFYGLLFLREPFSAWIALGIGALALSLFFVNFRKGENTISVRWLIFALLTLLSNGMCTTVQKMQQLAFDYTYANEFMIIALLITAVCLAVFGFITAPKESVLTVKRCWHWGLGHGLLNGLMNYFVLLLNTSMPASVVFPLVSCGNLLFVYLLSFFIWKERLTRLQTFGIVAGIASIIFFSI